MYCRLRDDTRDNVFGMDAKYGKSDLWCAREIFSANIAVNIALVTKFYLNAKK